MPAIRVDLSRLSRSFYGAYLAGYHEVALSILVFTRRFPGNRFLTKYIIIELCYNVIPGQNPVWGKSPLGESPR